MQGDYHKDTTQLYQLSAQFGNDKLIIFLRTDNKLFRKCYTSQDLPSEVEREVGKIQIIFQILKSRQNYEANAYTGELKLKTCLQINNKKYEKTGILYLQEVQLDNWQAQYRQMSQMRRRLTNIQVQEKADKEQKERKFYLLQQENVILKNKIRELNDIVQKQEQKFKVVDYELKRERKHKKQGEKRLQLVEQNVKVLQNLFLKSSTSIRPLQQTKETGQFQETMKMESNVDYDSSSPFVNRFFIKGNHIAYKGQDKVTTQLFMKSQLNSNKIERFFFKIIKTSYNNILVGIVDKNKQKKFRKSSNSENSICYFGHKGLIVYGNVGKGKCKEQGGGFREGQQMIMEIYLKQGTILWKRESTTIASIILSAIKEEDREWVPFIELRNKGDIIEWKKQEPLL